MFASFAQCELKCLGLGLARFSNIDDNLKHYKFLYITIFQISTINLASINHIRPMIFQR
ncbi:hypothetical protein GIB67_003415 [Kingdonia uniflora]|uniref:Uncharacterized protein n=1 Tax=Kingdonia uniflora TaxID=39325 RepID=A0A7J7P919_9MAGN|nr:hypothetical protein GIB67_003415 [Kingdonia uniflora]